MPEYAVKYEVDFIIKVPWVYTLILAGGCGACGGCLLSPRGLIRPATTMSRTFSCAYWKVEIQTPWFQLFYGGGRLVKKPLPPS